MTYTKEQALTFLGIIQSFAPFVPPISFNAMKGHPVLTDIMAVANAPDPVPAKKGLKKANDA